MIRYSLLQNYSEGLKKLLLRGAGSYGGGQCDGHLQMAFMRGVWEDLVILTIQHTERRPGKAFATRRAGNGRLQMTFMRGGQERGQESYYIYDD